MELTPSNIVILQHEAGIVISFAFISMIMNVIDAFDRHLFVLRMYLLGKAVFSSIIFVLYCMVFIDTAGWYDFSFISEGGFPYVGGRPMIMVFLATWITDAWIRREHPWKE